MLYALCCQSRVANMKVLGYNHAPLPTDISGSFGSANEMSWTTSITTQWEGFACPQRSSLRSGLKKTSWQCRPDASTLRLAFESVCVYYSSAWWLDVKGASDDYSAICSRCRLTQSSTKTQNSFEKKKRRASLALSFCQKRSIFGRVPYGCNYNSSWC